MHPSLVSGALGRNHKGTESVLSLRTDGADSSCFHPFGLWEIAMPCFLLNDGSASLWLGRTALLQQSQDCPCGVDDRFETGGLRQVLSVARQHSLT